MTIKLIPIPNGTYVKYTYGPSIIPTPCIVERSHVSHNGLYLYDLLINENNFKGEIIKFVPEEFIKVIDQSCSVTKYKSGDRVLYNGEKFVILSEAGKYIYHVRNIITGTESKIHKDVLSLDPDNITTCNVKEMCNSKKVYNPGDKILYYGEKYLIHHRISENRYSIENYTNPSNNIIVHEDDIYSDSPEIICDVNYKGIDPNNVTIELPGRISTVIPYATNIPNPFIGSENNMISDMRETFHNCLELSYKKNADYAGDADPFKNFRGSTHVGVDPKRAILVRMMDKMSRIGNLIDKEAQVTSESIDDTLMDVINYAAILKSYIKRNAK